MPLLLLFRLQQFSLSRSLSLPAMAKQGRGAKKQDKFGTGKVTPMQIAFMVDRYLSDNNYSATLSSFRSEASDLLSRTHGKKVPKGLMGLADILDDYIRIKEQKLIVDHEKQRVEAAMKGINDVIQVYYSETLQSASMPATTSPPQIVGSPTVPFFCGSNIGNPSHSNYAMHAPSTSNSSKPPLQPPKIGDSTGFSTPTNTLHSAEKRKASKSTAKEPPSPKKLRSQPSSTSNNVMQGGVRSSEEACGSNSRGKQLVQAAAPAPSLVVKKLFNHPRGCPPHPNNTSSPKTPPQALDSQTDKSLSPLENSSSINAAPDTACSMISSSQTIIISPLKQKGYYAVERSYQLTACSPIKAGAAAKLGRRDHVKGRLDFDRVEAPAELAPEKEQQQQSSCAADSCGGSPSDDAETPPGLKFDIPDFDIFDGDFLSGLLADIGDQNGAFSVCHSDNNCFLAAAGPGDLQQSSAAAAASSEGLGLQDYSANIRLPRYI